eukprot:TRINITY_DN10280_c0_g1_i1.p1 TRINITY_DN10280_c0_g1~~TRINITY_DN10280_c0_g1_i1.p1  ORF type:complete len:346 (-),score=67.34 TRINITY_DN10280_c0_g1_i1:66-1103(-)
MKAVVLEKPGDVPDSLRVVNDRPIPQPGPGEVRVNVKAAGLNPVDYKIASRGVPKWEGNYPIVLGLDVAGTIDALGEGVNPEQYPIGTRVLYHGNLSLPHGGYAEKAIVTAKAIARIPENVSFADAAALPCAGMTAYQALYRKLHILDFTMRKSILITGASGGVGGFAVQLAALSDLHPIIATCSTANISYVKSLGATHVIDYTTLKNEQDLALQIKEITGGRGVDFVLDTLSSESATGVLVNQILAFNGALVCVAGLPDFSAPGAIVPFAKAISVCEVALGGAHLSGDEPSQRDLAQMDEILAKLVAAGKLKTLISKRVSLEQVPQALAEIAGRHVRGKIIMEL